MERIYVIDTNILMHQLGFHEKLGVATACIPQTAIYELNGLKKSQDRMTSIRAREASNWILKVTGMGPINEGVLLGNGLKIKIIPDFKKLNPPLLNERGDNEILGMALYLSEKNNQPGQRVILLTNDTILLETARGLGLRACNFSVKSAIPMNYYDVLMVYKTATMEDIKQVRNELYMAYHPDRHPEASAETRKAYTEVTVQVNEAYRVLSDPALRVAYDQIGLPDWEKQFHTWKTDEAYVGPNFETRRGYVQKPSREETAYARAGAYKVNRLRTAIFYACFMALSASFFKFMDTGSNTGPAAYGHAAAEKIVPYSTQDRRRKEWTARESAKKDVPPGPHYDRTADMACMEQMLDTEMVRQQLRKKGVSKEEVEAKLRHLNDQQLHEVVLKWKSLPWPTPPRVLPPERHIQRPTETRDSDSLHLKPFDFIRNMAPFENLEHSNFRNSNRNLRGAYIFSRARPITRALPSQADSHILVEKGTE